MRSFWIMRDRTVRRYNRGDEYMVAAVDDMLVRLPF